MSLTAYREVCTDLLKGLEECQEPRFPFPGYITAAMDRARELLARPVPAEPATITPAPFTEQQLCNAWNSQADHANDWDSLDIFEQLAWAQARAIAADRAGRPAPAEPAEDLIDYQDLIKLCAKHGFHCDDDESKEILHELVQEAIATARKMVTPPAEGEAGDLVAELRRLAAQNPMGVADPALTRAAALIEQQAAELAALRIPPAEGEVGGLVAWLRSLVHCSISFKLGSKNTHRLVRAAYLLLDQSHQIAELQHQLDRRSRHHG